MTVTVGTSGGNKAVGAIFVGTAGGNKAVVTGYVGTGGGNKVFYSALAATAFPSSVSGTGTVADITTTSTTATPTGGVGPYTYAWEKVSGDIIVITSATSPSTTFSGIGMVSPETRVAIFRCLVTDTATGLSVYTNNVTATVERT